MHFLKQPYPFFHGGRTLIRNTFLLFVISFLFLFMLEPFNVYRPEHKFSYAVICLIHAGSATTILFIYGLIIKPWINEDNWKIYKEFIYLFFLLLLIGIGSFSWREIIYDNPENISLRYFLEEIRNSYLVGGLLIFIIVGINFQLLNRKNQKHAKEFPPKKEFVPEAPSTIPITASVSGDSFEMDPSQLLCAKADGNYVEFYLLTSKKIEKRIARLTLQEACEQLQSLPDIIKTHRAFLVNIRYINEVKGNAQGYLLDVEHLDFQVPVSRKNLKAFNQVMS